MTERKMFNEDELKGKLEKLGKTLGRRVRVFLIGGCAMIFRGYKLATKDVDMVFMTPEEMNTVIEALKNLGYRNVMELPKEYGRLGASTVLRSSDEFQVDIFLRQVCRALEITERMEKRAEFFGSFGNLDVYLIAPEDIFLFKGITDREGDLLDMRTLADRGINWNVIMEECRLQEKRRIWEYFLVKRLAELKDKHGIDAPITKELWKVAGDELIRTVFTEIIESGNDTADKIIEVTRKRFRYSESWTRKMLHALVKRGVLKIEKTGRKNRYVIK